MKEAEAKGNKAKRGQQQCQMVCRALETSGCASCVGFPPTAFFGDTC